MAYIDWHQHSPTASYYVSPADNHLHMNERQPRSHCGYIKADYMPPATSFNHTSRLLDVASRRLEVFGPVY